MEDGIFFNQSKYTKEMLKKFGLKDSKPTKTSMSTEIKLTKNDKADSVDKYYISRSKQPNTSSFCSWVITRGSRRLQVESWFLARFTQYEVGFDSFALTALNSVEYILPSSKTVLNTRPYSIRAPSIDMSFTTLRPSAIFHQLSHKLSRELLSFVDLYSRDIVSRNVVTLHIPSPFVLVVVVMLLLSGP
ncbi:hypothetical protein Tco_1236733 [Tanacetum coccineum]